MTRIAINDLNQSKALDTKALAKVRGGIGWGYKAPHKSWSGPISSVTKNLTNINTQLNIAVLSKDVFQANSNTVNQF